MQTGPLRLFWTTGVFFFWGLKDRFDFVFVSPATFRHDDAFQRIAQLPEVRESAYAPPAGRLASHQFHAQTYRRLLEAYAPQYVMLYDQSYPDNLYLARLTDQLCKNATRYYYQLGWVPTDWRDSFMTLIAEEVGKVLLRLPPPLRRPAVARPLVLLRSALSDALQYGILPLLTIGHALFPPLNLTTGVHHSARFRRLSSNGRTSVLVYGEREAKQFRAMGAAQVAVVRHPSAGIADAVFRFLIPELTPRDNILLLPTWGFTSRLRQDGWADADVVAHVASLWSAALVILLEKFPGFGVKLKLHPVAATDPVWKAIIERLQNGFSDLTVLPASMIAEAQILQARVIVGESGAALWWASKQLGKHVLSLDIFGYAGGDDMAGEAGIHYFKTLAALEAWDGRETGTARVPPKSMAEFFP